MRPTWDEYYMKIAEAAAERSTCFSDAKGVVIVVDNHIIATGYSGAPRGIASCKYDKGYCRKRHLGYGHGTGHAECLAVHAEANAILAAAYSGYATKGGTLYCTHQPCESCAKLIINAGIKKVIYKHEYPSALADELFKEAKVTCEKIKDEAEKENTEKENAFASWLLLADLLSKYNANEKAGKYYLEGTSKEYHGTIHITEDIGMHDGRGHKIIYR